MIKIIIFICSLCLPYCLLAQGHSPDACGSILNHEEYRDYKQQVQQNKRFTNSRYRQTVTLKLQPHIIRTSNGTGGLSLADLNTSIQQLNDDFVQVGFYFEYCTPNYIDNNDYYNEIALNRTLESQMGLNNVDDAINIFFVPNAVAYINGVPTPFTANWGTFPYQSPRNWVVMNNSFANRDNTLSHEVGHYFNLLHTHNTFDFNNQSIAAENVTRNSSNPCFNCETAGDLLCDTPADPDVVYTLDALCQYSGTIRDACSQLYQPDTRNIMSYNYTCRTNFTQGQIDRMWFALTQYRTNLANSCSGCPASLNVTQDVFNGQSEVQLASNSITATNSIFNGGTATYSAGSEVVLRPGFDAVTGASFDGTIGGCSNSFAQAPETKTTATAPVAELSKEISLTVFPNPASDQFELKFSSPADRAFVNITLVNIQGQLVKQTLRQEHFPKGAYNVSINTSDLPSGVYFVRLLTDKENVAKRIVILRK